MMIFEFNKFVKLFSANWANHFYFSAQFWTYCLGNLNLVNFIHVINSFMPSLKCYGTGLAMVMLVCEMRNQLKFLAKSLQAHLTLVEIVWVVIYLHVFLVTFWAWKLSLATLAVDGSGFFGWMDSSFVAFQPTCKSNKNIALTFSETGALDRKQTTEYITLIIRNTQ